MKNKLLFLFPVVFLFFSCSNLYKQYEVKNNSDFDVVLEFEDKTYSLPTGDTIFVDAMYSFTSFTVTNSLIPVKVRKGSPTKFYVENDYTIFNLTVVNHTNNKISFRVTNNLNSDFEIEANQTKTIQLYTNKPIIESEHKNFSFSANGLYLNFN